MKVLLVHYYCGYFDGTFTSIIDTYYNLQKFGIDAELKIISYENFGNSLRHIMNNFSDKHLVNSLTTKLSFEADAIICSSCLLYNNFWYPLKRLSLNANQILVLDSLDIQLGKLKVETVYGVIPPLNEVIDYKCILLCNQSNIDFCDLETYIYYHKFSSKRLLDNVHKKNVLNSIGNVHIYEYNRILRHEKYKDSWAALNENIGKVIFESLYYGLKVNYSADGYVPDGLSCYLRLFDIDPSINHFPLLITEEHIKEKLFMDKNDLLLELINDI